jgi:hypothetical protein
MRRLKSGAKVVSVAIAALIAMALVAIAQNASVLGESAHDAAMRGMPGMTGGVSDPGALGPMSMSPEAMSHMGTMALHIAWSDPRPANAADTARAAAIVAALMPVLEKYRDYHVAERDGFRPFMPQLKHQDEVHFTNYWYAFRNQMSFDPARPTSLLYRPTPDGGYVLIGAMYTARKNATEDQINDRVPLSVARWHRHVNFCLPPRGEMKTADWTKFGPVGTIATPSACDAAAGRFFPQIFGWMVHVYPLQRDPSKFWPH